jgi:hypothetical protein
LLCFSKKSLCDFCGLIVHDVFRNHNSCFIRFYSVPTNKSAESGFIRALMQQELSYSREFDKLLILTTGEVLRESLGDLNAQIIFEYLEKRSCPMQEIPKKLEVFSMELRRLLGWNRGAIARFRSNFGRNNRKSSMFQVGCQIRRKTTHRFLELHRKIKGSLLC